MVVGEISQRTDLLVIGGGPGGMQLHFELPTWVWMLP